jgi:hypothetical protein
MHVLGPTVNSLYIPTNAPLPITHPEMESLTAPIICSDIDSTRLQVDVVLFCPQKFTCLLLSGNTNTTCSLFSLFPGNISSQIFGLRIIQCAGRDVTVTVLEHASTSLKQCILSGRIHSVQTSPGGCKLFPYHLCNRG